MAGKEHMNSKLEKVQATADSVPTLVTNLLATLASVGGLLVTDQVVSSGLEQAIWSFVSVAIPAVYILGSQIKAGHAKVAKAQLRTAMAIQAQPLPTVHVHPTIEASGQQPVVVSVEATDAHIDERIKQQARNAARRKPMSK